MRERASLFGVWAKWERAVEQIATLNDEIGVFAHEPHPYTIHSHSYPESGRYRFELYPLWRPGRILRWGAMHGGPLALGATWHVDEQERLIPWKRRHSWIHDQSSPFTPWVPPRSL